MADLSTAPVYALDVVAWPPDSHDPATGYPTPGWAPEGWTPDADRYHPEEDDSFRWPQHNRRYLSRPAAEARCRLLRSYGAVVVVEESGPLVWPEGCDMCADRHAPGACPSAHPESHLLVPPTWERFGVCICGAPLVPMAEWCDAGSQWQHVRCRCGRLYVDEDTFFAIYDPDDLAGTDPCPRCDRRLAGWVPLAAPTTPGGGLDAP